jgi:hypothetical protein
MEAETDRNACQDEIIPPARPETADEEKEGWGDKQRVEGETQGNA